MNYQKMYKQQLKEYSGMVKNNIGGSDKDYISACINDYVNHLISEINMLQLGGQITLKEANNIKIELDLI